MEIHKSTISTDYLQLLYHKILVEISLVPVIISSLVLWIFEFFAYLGIVELRYTHSITYCTRECCLNLDACLIFKRLSSRLEKQESSSFHNFILGGSFVDIMRLGAAMSIMWNRIAWGL